MAVSFYNGCGMELVIDERPPNEPIEDEYGSKLELESEPAPKRLWMLEDEAIAKVRLIQFMIDEVFEKNKKRSGPFLWRYISNTKRVLNVFGHNGASIAYEGYLTPTMNTMYDIFLDALRGKFSFREALVYVSNLGKLAEKRHADSPYQARKEIYATAAQLHLINDKSVLEGESLFQSQCMEIVQEINTTHWEVHRWAGQKQPAQEDNNRRITDTMVSMLEQIRHCQTVPAGPRQTWERAYFNIIKLAKIAAHKHQDMNKLQSRFYKKLAQTVLDADMEASARAEIDKIETKWQNVPEVIRAGAAHAQDMMTLSNNAKRNTISNTEALDKIMRLGHQALGGCCFFSHKNPPELDKFYQEVADVALSPIN